MTERETQALVFTVLFGPSAILGVRATWRLWRAYLYDGESRAQVLLLTFAAVSTVITAAALILGALTLYRFLGYAPLPWATPVVFALTAMILLIPAVLERVIDYVAKAREEDPR